jgi:hypothetical protein
MVALGWVNGSRAPSALLPKAARPKNPDQKAPLGPGRPPSMKTYGDLVAAKNRALPLAFSMPGVN